VSKLRITHLRFMVPFLIIAWRAGLPVGDNSFLWHVRAGTEQLAMGRVLTTDPFSFTANGLPWRSQSWLIELGYGWLERMTGGIQWVPALKLVAMALTVALLGLVVFRVVGRNHLLTLAALLVIVWQAAPSVIPRPALIGYVFLALVIAFTFTERRPLWLLPPLFWVWASIHGTYPVGLGLLLLDAVRRRSQRQGVAVAIAGLATLATAHGIGAWWIVLQFFKSRGALDLIGEWQPPSFTDPFVLPFFLAVVGIIVAAIAGRVHRRDLWIVVPFLFFGLTASRNVWPAFMVLVPFAAAAFPLRGATKERDGGEMVVVNWGIAVVLVVAAVVIVAKPVQLSESRFPSDAALAALDEGRVFNGSVEGGYLIYADWPRHQVFIDDRAELYGAEGFERFQNIRTGVDVEETFSALDIQQVLARRDWPLVGYLELLGWEYRYQDDYFVVMAR
jgi:hypothetical protein